MRWGLFLVTSALFVLLFAQDSSPLFLNAGYDYDMFAMGGEFLRQGRRLYVDFFDNKGPYLFLINAIGLTLAKGKMGIYILEVLNLTWSMELFYRINRQFKHDTGGFLAAISVVMLFYATTIGGGDSVESWSLPWVLLPLLYALKYYVRKPLSHNPSWAFIYGFSFGIIAMMRVNNGAIIVGIALSLILYMLGKNDYRQLFINILTALCGLGVAVLPGLVYAITTGSLNEMVYAVLYYAFEYRDISGWVGYRAVVFNILSLLPCVILPIVTWKGFRPIFNLSLWISAMTFLTFVSGAHYMHYFTMSLPVIFLAVAVSYDRIGPRSAIMVSLAILVPQYFIEWGIISEKIEKLCRQTADDSQLRLRERVLASIPENGRDSIYQFEIDPEYWGLVYHSGHLPVGRYIGQQWFHINIEPRYAHRHIVAAFEDAAPRYIVASIRPEATPFASIVERYEIIDSVNEAGKNFFVYRKK